MATARLDKIKANDILKCFDGTTDITSWLNKLKVVARLQAIENEKLCDIIPLFLEGEAFAVYEHMPDGDKTDTLKVERALKEAFSLNPITAYELFKQRQWESEDC